MIETLAELLSRLKDKETALLKQYDIVKHPGIIGDMYEGLSKDLMAKSLFRGLTLEVSAGKIRGSNGQLSAEIDAMIVVGKGEQIPYTDKSIYEAKDVLVIIQVKKNLYSSDIEHSHENLRSIIDITDDLIITDHHHKMHEDAYQLICQRRIPASRDELGKEPILYQHIFHLLRLEAVYPTRIVWAYDGFKSEKALREAFIGYINKNVTTSPNVRKTGFGPLTLPNLISCSQFSIVKANGIPFGAPVLDDTWWPLFFSTNKTPMLYLLENIWTRLQYLFQLDPIIFGEDLKIDTVHNLLSATIKPFFDKFGWEYQIIPFSEEELNKPLLESEWEPSFLSEEEHAIISMLTKIEEIYYETDDAFLKFISGYPRSLNEILMSLKATGLVAIENGKLSLLTDQCVCGVTPDGRYFAGENKTGRVTRWATNNIKKKH